MVLILTILGSAGAVVAFVLHRNDILSKRIDVIDGRVEKTKQEAAEALLAHSLRTDSRQEAVRTELNTHVQALNARITQLSDTAARKDDVQALSERVAQLGEAMTQRLDRIIDMQRARP